MVSTRSQRSALGQEQSKPSAKKTLAAKKSRSSVSPVKASRVKKSKVKIASKEPKGRKKAAAAVAAAKSPDKSLKTTSKPKTDPPVQTKPTDSIDVTSDNGDSEPSSYDDVEIYAGARRHPGVTRRWTEYPSALASLLGRIHRLSCRLSSAAEDSPPRYGHKSVAPVNRPMCAALGDMAGALRDIAAFMWSVRDTTEYDLGSRTGDEFAADADAALCRADRAVALEACLADAGPNARLIRWVGPSVVGEREEKTLLSLFAVEPVDDETHVPDAWERFSVKTRGRKNIYLLDAPRMAVRRKPRKSIKVPEQKQERLLKDPPLKKRPSEKRKAPLPPPIIPPYSRPPACSLGSDSPPVVDNVDDRHVHDDSSNNEDLEPEYKHMLTMAGTVEDEGRKPPKRRRAMPRNRAVSRADNLILDGLRAADLSEDEAIRLQAEMLEDAKRRMLLKQQLQTKQEEDAALSSVDTGDEQRQQEKEEEEEEVPRVEARTAQSRNRDRNSNSGMKNRRVKRSSPRSSTDK